VKKTNIHLGRTKIKLVEQVSVQTFKIVRTTFTDFSDGLADVNYSQMGKGEERNLNALARIYTESINLIPEFGHEGNMFLFVMR
jgi:hypothetical protein